MSRGLRIFFTFLLLYGFTMTILSDMGFRDIFLLYGVIYSLLMSVMLIYFWDCLKVLMRDSKNIVWLVFKTMVETIGYLISLILVIFFMLGMILDSIAMGYLNWHVVSLITIVWAVGSIVSAINSLKDSK
jgi:hypothetical protein